MMKGREMPTVQPRTFSPTPQNPIVGRITPNFDPSPTDNKVVLVNQSAENRSNRQFTPFDIARHRETLGATQKEMGYIFATTKNQTQTTNYGANFYAWEKGVNNMPPSVVNQFEKMIERHNTELIEAEIMLQKSINSHTKTGQIALLYEQHFAKFTQWANHVSQQSFFADIVARPELRGDVTALTAHLNDCAPNAPEISELLPQNFYVAFLAELARLHCERDNGTHPASVVKIPIIHYDFRIDDEWQLFFDDFSECVIKRSIASKLSLRYYKNVSVIAFDFMAFKAFCESQNLNFKAACRDFDVHMAWARARLIEQEKII